MTAVNRDTALELDRNDPLASFRDRFELPEDIIYLDGNSLGALPKGVEARVAEVISQHWRNDLIKSWNINGWGELPNQIGDKIAKLIGAGDGEVICTDSTSVNLFKMLSAALNLRPGRKVIVTEKGNFPTDIYIAEGLRDLINDGHEIRLVENDEFENAITDDVAVVCLTQVDYRTGRKLDMAKLTEMAHNAGALMLWDLCHSAGAFPVDLNGCNADLAVGCSYKYLNGGPGAPAFLFVPEHMQSEIKQPLSGWHGHEQPFEFKHFYRPHGGIARNYCGTAPVLSMAALDAALDVMIEADLAALQKKSTALTDLFIRAVEQECAGHGFELASPRDGTSRGSQVSFRHENGYPIMQALIARGVIGDFRAPNVDRFGFAPLYVRYVDVWDAATHLREIMESGEWDQPKFHERAAIT